MFTFVIGRLALFFQLRNFHTIEVGFSLLFFNCVCCNAGRVGQKELRSKEGKVPVLLTFIFPNPPYPKRISALENIERKLEEEIETPQTKCLFRKNWWCLYDCLNTHILVHRKLNNPSAAHEDTEIFSFCWSLTLSRDFCELCHLPLPFKPKLGKWL